MAFITTLDRQPVPPPGVPEVPVRDRRGWSAADRAAFRELLRQLDAWCRSHDAPAGLNPWVAEEAIRRT